MENILQLNSRKGVVKFSETDLINYDLLRWVRVAFKGIGRSCILEDAPFENKAADLYVKKYPDTQVVLAERVMFNKIDNSVSVFLKTTSTPENRYFNTHNTQLVLTEKEVKKANTFKKKKLAISVNRLYGDFVQRATPVESDNPLEKNFKLSSAGDILTIKLKDNNEPVIAEWPDVKGVPLYPEDVVLLISDFSGGIDNAAIRSIAMPPYSELAPFKNLVLDIKENQLDFHSSISKDKMLDPKAAKTNLEDFNRTMILLGLESTDKSLVDFNNLYIDKEQWDEKYKDIIKTEFSGFEINSYDDFMEILSKSAIQPVGSKEYALGTALSSTLSQNLDFKDTYVPNITDSDKKKDLKKITPTNFSAYILPEDLNEAITSNLTDNNFIDFDGVVEELAQSNEELIINYKYLQNILQEDILDREINTLASKTILKKEYNEKNNLQPNTLTGDELEEIRETVESIYTNVGEDNQQKVEESINLLSEFCSLFPNIDEGLDFYRGSRRKLLTQSDTPSGAMRKSILSSLAFKDINTSFNPEDDSQISGLKCVKLLLSGLSNMITGTQKEKLENKPFDYLTSYLDSFERRTSTQGPKVYIPYKSLNKSQRQETLTNLGVTKTPMPIEEFFTSVLNDPIDPHDFRKNFTTKENVDLLERSGPATAENKYVQLIKSSWDSISAAEKEERMIKAYGQNFISNPDFDSLLFKTRSPERDATYKKLLDFHKYLADNEIYENLMASEKGGKTFTPEVKELYNQFMASYETTDQSGSQSKEIDTLLKEIEQLKVGTSNLKENDPNYHKRKQENEQLIKYYTDKIQSLTQSDTDIALNTLTHIPSFKEYEDFVSSQASRLTSIQDSRELFKVYGFAVGDSPGSITTYKNLKTYIKDHGLINLDIGEDKVDNYVDNLIGGLQLQKIKDMIIEILSSGEPSEFIDYESDSLSYSSLKKTYEQILNKLGLNLSSVSFDELNSYIQATIQTKNADKTLTNQEVNKLSRLLQKISEYVSYYIRQYKDHIEEQKHSLTYELEQYKNHLMTIDQTDPEYNEYAAIIKSIENELTELVNAPKQDEEILKTDLLQNLPEDLLAFIFISASDPNITIRNIEDKFKRLKSAAFPVELEINEILQKLNSPEFKPQFDKLTFAKGTDIGVPALNEEITSLAEKVQKTLIDEFIEDNSEIFGEDFTDSIGSAFGSGDIWVIGKMVTGVISDAESSSISAGDLIACTSEQLLKIDPNKIDKFYSKYQKELIRDGFLKNVDPATANLNYFKTEEDRDKYNTKQYIPAIQDFTKTEDNLRGSEIFEKSKKQDGVEDKGLLSKQKPEVSVSEQAQYSKIDSLKNEKNRLENRMENQIPVNFYDRKVREKQESISDMQIQQKDLSSQYKQMSNPNLETDPEILKELQSKLENIAQRLSAEKSELATYTEELTKASNKEKWHKNRINSINNKIKELQKTLDTVKDSDIEKQQAHLDNANAAIKDTQQRLEAAEDEQTINKLERVLENQLIRKQTIEKTIEELQTKQDKTPQITQDRGGELKKIEKQIQEIKQSLEYKNAVNKFNKEYVTKKKQIEENSELDELSKEIEIADLNDTYKDLLATARGFVKQIKDLNSERDKIISAIDSPGEAVKEQVPKVKEDVATSAKTKHIKNTLLEDIKDLVRKDFLANMYFNSRNDAVNFFNRSRGAQTFFNEYFDNTDKGFALPKGIKEVDTAHKDVFDEIITDFLMFDLSELSWPELYKKWSEVLTSDNSLNEIKDLYEELQELENKEKQAFLTKVKSTIKLASINKALCNIEESLLNKYIKYATVLDLKTPVFDSVDKDKEIKDKIENFNNRKLAAKMFDPDHELEKYEGDLIDEIDNALNEFRELHKVKNVPYDIKSTKEDEIISTIQEIIDEISNVPEPGTPEGEAYARNCYETNMKKDHCPRGKHIDETLREPDSPNFFDPEIKSFQQMVDEHYNKLSAYESGKSLLNSNQQTDTDERDGAISDDPPHETLSPSNATLMSKRTSAFDYDEADADELFHRSYDREKIIKNLRKEIRSLETKIQDIYNKNPNELDDEDLGWMEYFTNLHEELAILENEELSPSADIDDVQEDTNEE